MQTHVLERILFVVIVCTVAFAGLCLYTFLVSIYQSHWPPHVLASHLGDGVWSTTSCFISHDRWTPIESQQLDRGLNATFQIHASLVPPRGAKGDLETSQFLLSLRDRHASGIMYFTQSTSASASAAAAGIEVGVEACHESEEALQAETKTICALQPSRGLGVFAAISGHEYSARDFITITFNITVWLPGPRAALEVDTAQINMLHRRVHGTCNDVPLSFEPATAAAGPNIAAGTPKNIINNGLPLRIILTTTDAQITRRIYLADSKSDGYFHTNAHSLKNSTVIMFFGVAPNEAPDLGVSSTSGCDFGTAPLSCISAPFELMATMICPSADSGLGMEDPTGKLHNRYISSPIVRHGVFPVRDVE